MSLPPKPPVQQPKFVPTELRAKADLYEERNKLYGDNYKRFGPVMALIVGDWKPTTEQDWNRLGVLVQIVAKVTRYGENLGRGGHDDSLDDIAVYSMILKELDKEARS